MGVDTKTNGTGDTPGFWVYSCVRCETLCGRERLTVNSAPLPLCSRTETPACGVRGGGTETQNPKPETRTPNPETRNPKSETRDPKPEPDTELPFLVKQMIFRGVSIEGKEQRKWLIDVECVSFENTRLPFMIFCAAHRDKRR